MGRSHKIATTRTTSKGMRKSLNRTPRAPSLGALRLFEKFERRQPPSPKRGLSASRRFLKTNVQTTVFDRRERRTRVRFILPSSSLAPRTQLPSQQTLGTRGDLRQNAVRIIAVDHPIAPARTRRLVADSLRKSRRLAVDLRSPDCLRAKRAFAIAIVTRRAETPVGWLGEERSDE